MINGNQAKALLKQLNKAYLQVHENKEDAFWREKMGLKNCVSGEFEKYEIAYQSLISDPRFLPDIRQSLANTALDSDLRLGLEGWQRFFETHAIENPEALSLQKKIIALEGQLGKIRQSMNLGYIAPGNTEMTLASSVKLGLLLRTSPDEGLRRAAYNGLLSIEQEVLAKGFLEIVRERNRLGRLLGYEDYYDYKVSRNEGFSKRKLFAILDDLVQKTRASAQASVTDMIRERGVSAREGYNFPYFIAGDLTTQLDPYFPFEKALTLWGKSFQALGIQYHGATLQLDLLDRKGKYENGFMHGPGPSFIQHGVYQPARINFTANAIPGQVGSGQRALETLFHEGGHAAHFSNIFMPAPCFSQEYAPTSVAFAETQSMFLDSFIETPEWLALYAKNRQGESLPWNLMRQNIEKKHPYKAFAVRSMLTICYAEKALYEMSDAQLTPENVTRTLREIEQELQFLNSGARPALSVPHLLSGESSAYYHGYVLAEMAVQQTRQFFQQRDGHLVDNSAIGRDLANFYWKPGNSKTFLDLVQGLTTKPFSADAIVQEVTASLPEVLAAAEKSVGKAKKLPHYSESVQLKANIRIVHGDEIITECQAGQGFETMSQHFDDWLVKRSDAMPKI